MDEQTLKWFQKNNLTPPSHTSHGVTADDLADKMHPLKVHRWRLEGNRLVATTDLGEVVNHINPGYIMAGVDERNLPILKKL